MITVEYIWLDGTEGLPQLRSKTRVFKNRKEVEKLPEWSFDGGSTGQGSLSDSDRVLRPVRVYDSPFSEDGYLALCEVYMSNGKPHISNTRAKLASMDSRGTWFGFEQEYSIVSPNGKPFIQEDAKQGPHYCGTGSNRVYGRALVDNHVRLCHKAGITLFGTNAEVMFTQWEYQTRPEEAIKASDDLWVARYIMERDAEMLNLCISYDAKLHPDFNGAGCHTNVSTPETRDNFNYEVMMAKLADTHGEHIKVYGVGNKERLTGDCETSAYDTFTWGVGDRSASVRIPSSVAEAGCGYFEDRRPSAACDPYLVTARILETCL
jgi:glutamine synthetase